MPVVRAPPEWGIEPVPSDKRTLRLIDYFVLWSSLGVGLLVLQAGALLVPSLSIGEAFAVSLIGSVIGSLLLAAAGLIGCKYGVPTMVSIRPTFGKVGSYLPSILNIIQLIGWTAFEFMVMAEAATSISGAILGEYTKLFWLLVFTVWCTLLALGGPVAVVRDWLEKFAIWLVYASTAWITIQVLTTPKFAAAVFSSHPTHDLPLTLALDLVIAMPISWMPLVSDYNRFASSARGGFAGTLLGYTLANTWFYTLGAALALGSGQNLVVSSILSLFMGSFAMLPILVDETDNAFADIYSTAVSIQNIIPRIRQWKLIIVVSAASAAIAYTVPLAQYENFLLMIGAFFVPLFGVVLSDFILVRHGDYAIEEFYSAAPKVRIPALFAWFCGAIVYFYIAYMAPSVGASLPAFFVAFIVYAVMSKIVR